DDDSSLPEVETLYSRGGKIKFLYQDLYLEAPRHKVHHALKLAGILIENNFVLKRQIVIMLKGYPPCERGKYCIGYLASSYVANFYTIPDQFSSHTAYPPALFKQLPNFEKYEHSYNGTMENDMRIKFNWDYNYYFPMDYPTKCKSDQYDFLDLILHEISHGLGINSRFSYNWFKFVTTQWNPVNDYEVRYESTIFDWHLYDQLTHLQLASVLKDGIKGYYLYNMTAAIKELNLTERYRQITIAIATPGRLIFPSLKGENITLFSGKSLPLTNPSHLSYAYYQTQDDLIALPREVVTPSRTTSSTILTGIPPRSAPSYSISSPPSAIPSRSQIQMLPYSTTISTSWIITVLSHLGFEYEPSSSF
ncbi:hypothetical protein L0F63_003100, partial [Massospora cicadina]